jgi:hypothetical protein
MFGGRVMPGMGYGTATHRKLYPFCQELPCFFLYRGRTPSPVLSSGVGSLWVQKTGTDTPKIDFQWAYLQVPELPLSVCPGLPG